MLLPKVYFDDKSKHKSRNIQGNKRKWLSTIMR